MTIDELRPWQDKAAVLHLSDGEITTAKIVFVDAEYEDIVVTVLQSTRFYKNAHKSDFTIRAADIVRIEATEGDSQRMRTSSHEG